MEADEDNANNFNNMKLKAYLRIVEMMRRCAFVRFKLLI